MKKVLSILAITLVINCSAAIKNNIRLSFIDYPAKTIVIKNPSADDTKHFFSENKYFQFEVYKAGSEQEVTKLIEEIKKDASVESVVAGKSYGDFTPITLILKSNKNKESFIKLFKKAGLMNIKINNTDVKKIESL